MRIVRTAAEVRSALAPHRAKRVGLVPTMGALHVGHASLMQAARTECEVVIASLFVNPTQFNDAGDLAKYPRQEARDAEIAASAGVDMLFAPDVGEIYPADHVTSVRPGGPAEGHEGAHRPGHFEGVATVCLILFNIVQPDVAYFGQKDAQQLAVIRQVVHDLALPIEIRAQPTVRDADGLAMSSRNVQLSTEERAQALAIPRALRAAVAAHRRGADPVAAARRELAGLPADYIDLASFDGHPTLVVAVHAGATRLIDNVPLDQPELAGLG
jgi:pantoate--beta-alanine ligase